MRRALVTVLGAAFALAVGTATATAAPEQLAGQSSASGQGAGALAGTSQFAPSNTAAGIRVLSPGDDGDVSQSNDASAKAGAVNLNGTGQDVDQSQGGGGGTQEAGQANDSDQSASAGALAAQEEPSNTAVGIGVLSPGDSGDVSQSNSADADATAANGNLTGQEIDQSQGGTAAPTAEPATSPATAPAPCGCEHGGTQVAGQSNDSDQSAEAGAAAVQEKPSNTAVGIRVLSPGDDGDVEQSNSADADAKALNGNLTHQDIDQSQGGAAAPVRDSDAAKCGCETGGTQVAGQSNDSDQSAAAGALAVQKHPSNTAVGIRVLSPGDGGDVSQSNSADADAKAANGNLTGQEIDQSQGGSGTQVAGQKNDSDQSAEAGAAAVQEKPSNTAVGIRVLSPGDDGDVEQSNSADADAKALNGNLTHQDIDQSQGGAAAPVRDSDAAKCGCETGGTQVAGQSNDSDQSAAAGALAVQKHPSNTAVGIRVLSPGDGGDVSQSNSADADAKAANGNLTGQEIDQSQGGSGTQVAGQKNDSDQSAEAGAAAVQEKPSNTAVGIRVLSPGDDGDVEQSNSADADAKALNGNLTHQDIDQSQGGAAAPVRDSDAAKCGCETGGTQVAGQSNDSDQSAAAGALAVQKHPSNTAVGIRVLSPGDGGDVSQSNSADADAKAANGNLTGQEIDQSQGGSGTQVAGQKNDSDQSAEAGAAAVQEKPSNTAVGIRVLSPGDDGDVEQSNSADADAKALNGNLTHQDIDQSQGGTPCGCYSDDGTQVAGQSNKNWQAAGSVAVAAQDHPSNTAVGIRVLSSGDDGDVDQSNSADAAALAANGNFTHQSIDQYQGGAPCGCGAGGTQVAGQANTSGQHAFALGLAAQLRPSNSASSTKVGDGVGCGCAWRLSKIAGSDSGDVSQSNAADARVGALNLNATGQDLDQTAGGGTQVAGQLNRNWQGATAIGAALQFGAANRAT